MKKNLRYFKLNNGKKPFKEWLCKLKDPTIRARILNRLDRVSLGNYGDYKDGVRELRLAFGAGYRIYFAEQDGITVILLIGGDKSTQSKDVALAKQYWQTLRSNYDE